MITQQKTSRPEMIPSLSGEKLLRKPDIAQLVNDIKNLVSCPNRIYKRLYSKTLRNLAEYCQAMPYSEDEFNWNRGFLMRQLNLALTALKLRRGILFPQNAGAESIAAEEAQWTYAIFAGSLVKNLYQLQDNREVHRYNLQGDPIGNWSPIVESLYKKSFYYSVCFTTHSSPKKTDVFIANNSSMKKTDVFMATISRYIFSPLAISWLSTNTHLFKLWWDVVLHRSSTNNDIEKVIQLAGNKIGITL